MQIVKKGILSLCKLMEQNRHKKAWYIFQWSEIQASFVCLNKRANLSKYER